MKFSWKGYWQPTPKGIRKIADAILAGAMTVSTFAAIEDHHIFAVVIMIVAGVAKLVSNFFTDETEVNNTIN
jgi:hypothetical protein